MDKKDRSTGLFLREIIEAMEKISRFVYTYDEESFVNDEVISDAVIKNLIIK